MLIIVSQLEANWSQVPAVFDVRASHQPLFFLFVSDVCALVSSAYGTGSATSKCLDCKRLDCFLNALRS